MSVVVLPPLFTDGTGIVAILPRIIWVLATRSRIRDVATDTQHRVKVFSDRRVAEGKADGQVSVPFWVVNVLQEVIE